MRNNLAQDVSSKNRIARKGANNVTLFQQSSFCMNPQQAMYKDEQKNSKMAPRQSSKKSNKIIKAKQLLAQRLKQVTTLEFQKQNPDQSQYEGISFIRQENTKIQKHLNPISKLTSKPFVRSKTCDEMRKQYSAKKQRKRNNSASKFNTPNTNAGYDMESNAKRLANSHNPQRTGQISQKQVIAQSQKLNVQSKSYKNDKIQTQQFSLNPFNCENSLMETFNHDQIQKLIGSGKQTKKRQVSKKAVQNYQKQSQSVILTDLVFPFKIDTVVNKTNAIRKEKNINKFVSQPTQGEQHVKFTPKLQRYHNQKPQITNSKEVANKLLKCQLNTMGSQQNDQNAPLVSQTVLNKMQKARNFSSFSKVKPQQMINFPQASCHQNRNLQVNNQEQEENEHNNLKRYRKTYKRQSQLQMKKLSQEQFPNCYDRSQNQRQYFGQRQNQNEQELHKNVHIFPHNTYQTKSQKVEEQAYFTEQNQVITSLSLTNAILQEKIMLKQKQIQQLSRNYVSVKNQLQYIRRSQNDSPMTASPFGYSGPDSNHRSTQQYFQSVASPRFHQGVELQFSQQRPTFQNQPQKCHPYYQQLIYNSQQQSSVEQNPAKNISSSVGLSPFGNVSLSPFPKRKQLFASDLSEKVSEQFDSEEIYHANRQMEADSRVSKWHTFKKSNFYRPTEEKGNMEKRQSLVYTLEQEIDDTSQRKNTPQSCENLSSDQKMSQNRHQQSFLLESVFEKDSSLNFSHDGLNSVSPSKIEAERSQMFSYYRKRYINMPIQTSNADKQTLSKFNYYLTPQKDEGYRKDDLQGMDEEQGLFSRAISSIKKQKKPEYKNQTNLQPQQKGPSLSNFPISQNRQKYRTKINVIDTIIENNIQ